MNSVKATNSFAVATEPAEVIKFVCDRPNDVFMVNKAAYEASPEKYTPHIERWADGSPYYILTPEAEAEAESVANRPSREGMVKEVGGVKDRKVFEGIYVEELSGWLPSTPNDAIMYNAFATMAFDGTLPAEGQVWTLMDKTVVYLPTELVLKLPTLAVQQQTALYAYEQQLKERVRTEEAYWLIDINAGWPPTFYTNQPK
jgi:hypothetical protein